MGMVAGTLRVSNYRSFDSYELSVGPSATILVGPNAAGKTNLVEALQLLTAAQSFRRPRSAELVREGCSQGMISLELDGDGRRVEMGCAFEDGKRVFLRNGKRVQAAGVRGVLPSVLFCPDHLDMVKRSASVRRQAVDDFGVQLNAQYAKLVSSYGRIVEQRNNLLKDPCCSDDLLKVWDESLVEAGASLIMHRIALVERVRAYFRGIYRQLAPNEEADIRYVASVARGPALPAARDEAAAMFLECLSRDREDERRRGVTLSGPHRDDVFFAIDGHPAREFGSQGQQRSLVLAWKMAEVRVTQDILGQQPLLLLDDVMSELDADRRRAVMAFVEGGVQTVITTTNLGYFADSVLGAAQVVEVGDGQRR